MANTIDNHENETEGIFDPGMQNLKQAIENEFEKYSLPNLHFDFAAELREFVDKLYWKAARQRNKWEEGLKEKAFKQYGYEVPASTELTEFLECDPDTAKRIWSGLAALAKPKPPAKLRK